MLKNFEPSDGRDLIVLAVICMITVWLYWPGLSGGAYFDDVHTLLDNTHIRISEITSDTLLSAANSFQAGGRQISMISFALNYYFFGAELFSFKLVNLVLHLCTGLLVYALVRCIASTLSRVKAGILVTIDCRYMALLTAGFWLLFPINLGTILYLSQRMNVLSCLFMALGILVYLIIRNTSKGIGAKVFLALISTVLFTLLAFYSKENGALLPAYIILLELVVFRQWNDYCRRLWGRSKMFRLASALTISLSILFFLMFACPYFGRLTDVYAVRDFTMLERILTECRVLVFYISQILFPNNAELSMWHDDVVISTGLFSPVSTFLSILALSALIAIGTLTIKVFPLIGLGVFWFFLGHSIESTFLPLELVHEHRNYFSSIGVALLMSYIILATTMLKRSIKILVIGGLLVLNGSVLHARSVIWSNDFSKAVHEAKSHPTSADAQFVYASFLYVAASDGNELIVADAFKVLSKNLLLDKKTIANEVLLMMLSSYSEFPFNPDWVISSTRKLELYGYSAINNRSIKGLTDHLKSKDRNFDFALVAPIYDEIVRQGNPRLVTFAAIYESEVTRDYPRALKLFEMAEKRSNYRPVHTLNLLRAQLKLRLFDQACGSLKRLESLPVSKTRLFAEEMSHAERWLNGKCAS